MIVVDVEDARMVGLSVAVVAVLIIWLIARRKR